MKQMVTVKPGPLTRAMKAASLSSRAIERVTDRRVSRSTVNNLTRVPNYSISRDKAEAVATALGRSVGELFVHHDAAPLRDDT